jgi:hypothetical protein
MIVAFLLSDMFAHRAGRDGSRLNKRINALALETSVLLWVLPCRLCTISANARTDKSFVFKKHPTQCLMAKLPITVSLSVYDELVDVFKPGDRVIVSGIYRPGSVPVRSNPRQTSLFQDLLGRRPC